MGITKSFYPIEFGKGGGVAPGEVHLGGHAPDGPEEPLVLVLDFLLPQRVPQLELAAVLGRGGQPVRDDGHLGAGQLLHQPFVLLADLVESLLVVVAGDMGQLVFGVAEHALQDGLVVLGLPVLDFLQPVEQPLYLFLPVLVQDVLLVIISILHNRKLTTQQFLFIGQITPTPYSPYPQSQHPKGGHGALGAQSIISKQQKYDELPQCFCSGQQNIVSDQIVMSLTANYGNSQAPPAAETKKIFCAYHRTQFLTNFCIEKQCLMPLCPSCVAEHTQQHYQSSQKPTYVNLNEALHQVKQRCYATIVSLEECNRKNDDIIKYREGLESNIHEQLSECKQEIYIRIEQIFQKYELRLIKEVQEKYRECSVYQPEEAQTIKEYITEQIELLYDKIGLLKSDQCLAALIRFYDHEQQEYEDGLKDVNDYLVKHRKIGNVIVKLNAEAMNQRLDGLCENLLVLAYVTDQDKEKDDKNIRNSKLRKNPSTNVVSMTPIQKEKSALRPLAASSNKITTPVGNFQSKSKNLSYY